MFSECVGEIRYEENTNGITYEAAHEDEQDDQGQNVGAGSILHEDLLRVARRRALTLGSLEREGELPSKVMETIVNN